MVSERVWASLHHWRAQRPRVMKVSPFERRGFDLLLLLYSRERKASDENSHSEAGELLSWKVSVGILCRRGMPSRCWGKCAEKNSEGYRSIEMSGRNWSSVWKKGEKGHLQSRPQLEKSRCSFIRNAQTNIGFAWQFSWQFREVDKVYQAREKPGEAARNLFEKSTHVIFKRWAQSVRKSV